MKVNLARISVLVGLTVLCASATAFAQSQVTVKYTGKYSTTWTQGFTVYEAGIYGASITGQPGATGMICDDFRDDTTSGETWTAKAYNVSTLVSSGNLSNTLFGKTIGVTGYAEVATLVSLMFGGGTTYGTVKNITQSQLASAIWDITTPGGLSGLSANALALVNAVTAAFKNNTSAATSYLASLKNLWILTPANLGPGEPQEMWTENLSMPEGGAALMYLLLATLFCGWMFFLRNQERVRG